MTRFERDELISTYSVVLPLDDLIAFCGLGCHLQPARSACFQLLYLTHTDAGKSEEKKSFMPLSNVLLRDKTYDARWYSNKSNAVQLHTDQSLLTLLNTMKFIKNLNLS